MKKMKYYVAAYFLGNFFWFVFVIQPREVKRNKVREGDVGREKKTLSFALAPLS